MATRVIWALEGEIDIGARTPDRRALAMEYLRSLVEELGATGGLPAGARQISADPQPMYTWEDANWTVTYMRSETKGLLRRSVVVTILNIELADRAN